MKPQLFLKLSEEVSKDFSSLMATAIMQKTLESLKDATDTGTFKFVISTDDEDRQGEKVNQAGLDFTHYMKNPVVLWGHNYGEPPVGVSTRIYRDGNKTMAEGKWAPTAFAQELRKLYDAGFLRACSIGYIPKELDENGNTQKGEVLEFSIVSIPANPFALTADTIKQYKFDLNMLAAKGIDFKMENEIKTTTPVIKDAMAGDACQLDDGTPGIFGNDDSGELICQPVKDASTEPTAVKTDEVKTDPEPVTPAEPEKTDEQKAVEPEKAKASVADELAESQEKQAKYQKVYKVYDVFDAFICAYLDDTTPVTDFEKLLDEAIALMKGGEKQMSELLKKFFVVGKYKKFSKTNLETLKGAIAEFEKAMACHDSAAISMADVHKSHKAVHAALKGLVSEPNDGGDEGKTIEAPAVKAEDPVVEPSEPKVDKTLEASEDEKALEGFLTNRDLLKSLSKGIDSALEKWNKTYGKKRPADSGK